MKAFTRIIATAALTAASVSYGAFALFEDFDSVTDWTINGDAANTLGVDSTTFAGENVGVYTTNDGALTSYYKGLGSNSIADSSTGTVFFRIHVPDQGSDVQDTSHWLGTSAELTPGAFGPNNTYVGTFDEVDNSTVNFLGRNGNTGSNDIDDFTIDSWYNVWMVIDNTANTYDVYVNQGTSSAVLGDRVASALPFRTNTTADGVQSTVSLFGATTGNVTVGREVFFDDVYVDNTGSNLGYAIPEPGTLALVGIALGALLVFRRKR